jgi:hypothetical protein
MHAKIRKAGCGPDLRYDCGLQALGDNKGKCHQYDEQGDTEDNQENKGIAYRAF